MELWAPTYNYNWVIGVITPYKWSYGPILITGRLVGARFLFRKTVRKLEQIVDSYLQRTKAPCQACNKERELGELGWGGRGSLGKP